MFWILKFLPWSNLLEINLIFKNITAFNILNFYFTFIQTIFKNFFIILDLQDGC